MRGKIQTRNHILDFVTEVIDDLSKSSLDRVVCVVGI